MVRFLININQQNCKKYDDRKRITDLCWVQWRISKKFLIPLPKFLIKRFYNKFTQLIYNFLLDHRWCPSQKLRGVMNLFIELVQLTVATWYVPCFTKCDCAVKDKNKSLKSSNICFLFTAVILKIVSWKIYAIR